MPKKQLTLAILGGLILLIAIVAGTYMLFRSSDDQPTDEPSSSTTQPVEKEFTSEGGIPVQVTSDFNREGATITSSPIEFTGRAPKAWGEDGTFMVRLMGNNNNLLVEGMAMFDPEWHMNDEDLGLLEDTEGTDETDDAEATIPFTVELPEFELPPSGTTGQLILERTNSGLFDPSEDTVVVEVRF